MSARKILTIDVYSDAICPWCYIGKRRLDFALTKIADHFEPVVEWHPFELNPDMPLAGLDRKEYRSAKFGSWEKSMALDEQVKAVGLSEGIGFRHDLMKRTPNTLAAHKLVLMAGRQARQDETVEAIFSAYFVEGKDIGDERVLIELGESVGLNPNDVEEFLRSEQTTVEVKEKERDGLRLGIHAVPNFVLNTKISLPGAQPIENFIAAFEQAS